MSKKSEFNFYSAQTTYFDRAEEERNMKERVIAANFLRTI